MLTVNDNLIKSNTLTSACRLVSFDIIDMFPSIDNISGLKIVKTFLMLGNTNIHLQPALLKLLNCEQDVTILFLTANVCYRVTAQHRVLIFHVLIVILSSNILMLKLYILQQLSVGRDLDMIFLSGHVILMNLIYFLIT